MVSADAAGTARNLLQVSMLLMRGLNAALRQREAQLSPVHIGILARIDDGPCNLTELARHQAVRPPTASRSVALLVKRGWVRRRRPADNRRQVLFTLTPAGRKALAAMKVEAERHVAEKLGRLSATECARIDGALIRLETILRPEGKDQ